MDERSSECKRTDRACDMLERGIVFFDGDVLVSAMRANLVMRRGRNETLVSVYGMCGL
jgi:hypothetical protein